MIIDETAKKQAWMIWEWTQSEPEYVKMLEEIRMLENEYEKALALLPEKQEETVRDFVAQCETMSWRMLQIACMLMRFPNQMEEQV